MKLLTVKMMKIKKKEQSYLSNTLCIIFNNSLLSKTMEAKLKDTPLKVGQMVNLILKVIMAATLEQS
jgi:hypothetical protein